jgi:protein TonB
MSKRMGEQGKVVLRILVNEKGHPDQVQIQTSSGFARLDEAGRQAGLRAVFKPRLEDGRPVSVYVLIPVNFQLTS